MGSSEPSAIFGFFAAEALAPSSSSSFATADALDSAAVDEAAADAAEAPSEAPGSDWLRFVSAHFGKTCRNS